MTTAPALILACAIVTALFLALGLPDGGGGVPLLIIVGGIVACVVSLRDTEGRP